MKEGKRIYGEQKIRRVCISTGMGRACAGTRVVGAPRRWSNL